MSPPEGWQGLEAAGLEALQRGEVPRAEALLEEALRAAAGGLPLASALSHLARVQLARGRGEEALAALERALAIRRRALGPDHPGVASLYHQLGDAYLALRDPGRAREAYGKALAIDRKVLGERHPHVASDLKGLAEAYRLEGKGAEAQALYRKALEIAEQALGSRHPEVLRLRARALRPPS